MKLSIIVPVYMVEQFLPKCIESILAQTFTSFELILVNDGSVDRCGFICDEYEKRDKRIKVIHQPNGGLSAARNAAINIAQGAYLSFVDSDDYIDSTMIQKLYSLANNYDADIAECSYYTVRGDKQSIREYSKEIEYGENNFLIQKYLDADLFYGVVTKLYRASLFDNIRFPKGRIFEEQWLTLNLCLKGFSYVRTSEPLYYYVKREGSILNSALTHQKAREYIHRIDGHLFLINTIPIEKSLKYRLNNLMKEKSVYWYLDLALSKDKIIRKIYSKLFINHIHINILSVIKSQNIPLKNKISFTLCRLKLTPVALTIKKLLNKF